MIIAYSSFYNVHSEIELFSYQIDAYAVFFIRMLWAIAAPVYPRLEWTLEYFA